MIDNTIKKNKELNKPNFFGVTASGISGNLSTPSGGWVELGRHERGSAGDCVTVSCLSAHENLMFLTHTIQNGGYSQNIRFNGDGGTNYASRRSHNGAADTTLVNDTDVNISDFDCKDMMSYGYIKNISAQEKLVISHTVNQRGIGECTAPEREETVGKWDNVCTVINQMTVTDTAVGCDYATGSQLIVLGWDKCNTHDATSNFWQPLGYADLSGGASANLDSGSFAGKEWLMVNAYLESGTGNANNGSTFNNDSCSNYATRRYVGCEQTNTNHTSLLGGCSSAHGMFVTSIIRNQSDKEKLGLTHTASIVCAGECSAPVLGEFAQKWDNTASQITSIKYTVGGTYGTNSYVQVWGAD